MNRATEALVKAAQQVREREEDANVQVNKRMVGGVAQVSVIQPVGLHSFFGLYSVRGILQLGIPKLNGLTKANIGFEFLSCEVSFACVTSRHHAWGSNAFLPYLSIKSRETGLAVKYS